MPESYNSGCEPLLLPTERPRCPKCKSRMALARIKFGPAHADLRMFECPKCDHVHNVLVEDPMKSANAGWQHSELKPPR